MLLSQKLAGFSKGDADVLRKAMGKKQKAVLDKMKDKFIKGCQNNGHTTGDLRKDLDRLGSLSHNTRSTNRTPRAIRW